MISKEQHDILIGFLRGDASIEYDGQHCRVRFDHSIKEKDYVYWLAEQLKPFSQYVLLIKSTTNAQKKQMKRSDSTLKAWNCLTSIDQCFILI